MRVKPDGSLDGLDHWKDAPPWLRSTEQLREELIHELMRVHQFTREQAEEQLEGFF